MKKLILLIFGLATFYLSHGQTVRDPSASANNSEHKIQNTDAGENIYTVDPVSGAASVNVPIFDYSIDGLNLGISLSYDTRGIKVDRTASDVGLGWELVAGGKIERVVNGIEDDNIIDNNIGIFFSSFMYGTGEYPDDFSASICGKAFDFQMSSSDNYDHLCNAAVGKCHPNYKFIGELFFDSLGHYVVWDNSGNLAHNSSWTMPSNFNTAPDCTAMGIRLTDEKGNLFYFIRGAYQKKYYEKNTVKLHYYPTTKWVLAKVVTHTGAEIKYTYGTFQNIKYSISHQQQVEENQRDFTDWKNGYHQQGISIIVDSDVIFEGGVRYLSKIEYPNGTVVTIGTSSGTRCDIVGTHSIESFNIHSGFDNNVYKEQTFKLNYSYFHTPYVVRNSSTNAIVCQDTATDYAYTTPCSSIVSTHCYLDDQKTSKYLRLKLNSIYMYGSDNTTNELYYKFTYNPLSLPRRTSPIVDCYGYYNGLSLNYFYNSTASQTFDDHPNLINMGVAYHTCSFYYSDNSNGSYTNNITYGVDRTPILSSKKASILTNVENGKKGSISFTYTDNSATNTSNASSYYNAFPPTDLDQPDAQDGVCINQITKSDGFNSQHDTKTQYTFVTGDRLFRGGYFWYPVVVLSDATTTPPIETVINRVYENNFISYRDNIHGSNHVYTDVIEKNIIIIILY